MMHGGTALTPRLVFVTVLLPLQEPFSILALENLVSSHQLYVVPTYSAAASAAQHSAFAQPQQFAQPQHLGVVPNALPDITCTCTRLAMPLTATHVPSSAAPVCPPPLLCFTSVCSVARLSATSAV